MRNSSRIRRNVDDRERRNKLAKRQEAEKQPDPARLGVSLSWDRCRVIGPKPRLSGSTTRSRGPASPSATRPCESDIRNGVENVGGSKGSSARLEALVLPPRDPEAGRLRGGTEEPRWFVGELKEEKRGSVASRCRRAALTCLVRNSLRDVPSAADSRFRSRNRRHRGYRGDGDVDVGGVVKVVTVVSRRQIERRPKTRGEGGGGGGGGGKEAKLKEEVEEKEEEEEKEADEGEWWGCLLYSLVHFWWGRDKDHLRSQKITRWPSQSKRENLLVFSRVAAVASGRRDHEDFAWSIFVSIRVFQRGSFALIVELSKLEKKETEERSEEEEQEEGCNDAEEEEEEDEEDEEEEEEEEEEENDRAPVKCRQKRRPDTRK
ncbi:hypothetical protein K0M31_000786 [Melipona bicolor]|uniref:Uncharacterized protein n=1 Tax=Melipona bicolor TaxID=60889 RepID=A0AA40KX25_9HYME|nr:hypothetical protein K0M31_000786 [Melipona bicolor]